MNHSLPAVQAGRALQRLCHAVWKTKACALLMLSLLWAQAASAQLGAVGSHDPGSVVKEGSKYWMFTTGDGIYGAYSTDLINWTPGAQTVFPSNPNSWPAWINTIVPGFAGNFWAPECTYMNGKYYMYYSCSTFGSSTSAIGLATSLSLDPASPNYGWTDQGLVVSSSSSADVNAIDPAILKDANGQLYMYYGSFSSGLGVLELDPQTGLKKAGATTAILAGNTTSGTQDWEAPYVVKENGFYYFYANRGFCCRGLSSTYRIVVGRSASPTGPFVDKNGVSLRATNAQATAAGFSGVGSLVLGSSGRYVGPGHFGLLREAGVNYVSMHYYDGMANGAPKLDLATLKYDANNWPIVSRDWLAAGRYTITNKNSGLVWDAWGCTASLGSPIAQGPWLGALCQQWDFVPVGNGYYKIANALNANRVADLANCVNANGTTIGIWDWLNNDCQKMKVQRAANGSFIFSPAAANNRLLEVPAASNTPGVQLGLWDYTGHDCQKWTIETAPATWTGATSTAWATAGNWSLGAVPTASDNVIIPAGMVRYPLIAAGTAAVNNLAIKSGGALNMSGGQVTLTGNLTNDGTLTATGGLLAFAGAAAQTLGGTQPSTLADLSVGAAGLALGSPATVAGVLALAGNLTTNNQVFTLRSTATGTALVVNNGGVVIGNATVQRYLDPSLNPGVGYRHYSAPVSNTTLADLTTSGYTPEISQASAYNTSATPGSTTPFPTLFAYDQSRLATATNNYTAFDKGFVVPTALSAPMSVGRGYVAQIGAAQVVDFVGALTTGPQTLSLSRNAAGTPNAADAGWHLVGNPYPSPLDFGRLAAGTDYTGLDASMYVFQSSGPYAGSYRAFVNGLPAGGGVVASGQGFFMRVSAGQAAGTLTFRDAHRLTSQAAPAAMYRPTDLRPLVRLELRAATGPADVFYAYAQATATDGFDSQYDAQKLPNPTGLNLSSRASTAENLSIDGRAAFTAATALPLSVGVPAAGTYTLAAGQLDNLPVGLGAYLHDAQTGQAVALSLGSSYSFSVTAAQAQALLTGRFTLHFGPATALATASTQLAGAVSVYPNPAHEQFTISLPGVAGASMVQAELRNALGQLVHQQSAPLPASGTALRVPTAQLAAGVYVLHLTAGPATVSQKIVLQ
jgi:hypothetical protein